MPRGADPGGAGRAVGPELARVLLVAGSGHRVDHLVADLRAEGFRVVLDATGESGFDEARLAAVDVVVLDLGLAAQSGLGVCGAIRARSTVPMLAMGTAVDEAAVLAAFTAGADQYTTVDTSSRLVVARLRALLRRRRRTAVRALPPAELAVTIDEATGAVLVAGGVVSLSRQELEVLRTLLSRPGMVISRAELAESWPTLGSDRRLDFVIRRLRQKLEAVDGRRRISAVRGVGFRYQEHAVHDVAT